MDNTLWGISYDLLDFFNKFDKGEFDEVEGDVIDEAWDNINIALDEKLDGCACYVKEIRSKKAMLKAQLEFIKHNMEVLDHKEARFLDYIKKGMEVSQRKKFKNDRTEIKLNKSQAVNIVDLSKIPTEFLRYKPAPAPEADKAKIKAAFKEGVLVSGAEMVDTSSVTIGGTV